MTDNEKQLIRRIYQGMVKDERQLLERAMLMKKRERLGLVASMTLSDEDKELVYNMTQMSNEEVADLIAHAARGWVMRLLSKIFGW